MNEIGNHLDKVSIGSSGASLGLMVSEAISKILSRDSNFNMNY